MFYLASPYSHPAVFVRLTAVSRCLACDATANIGRHIVFSRIIHGHTLVLHGLPTNLSFLEQFDRDHLLNCDEAVVWILHCWRESIGVGACC